MPFFQLSKTRHMLGEEFGRLKEHYQHRYTIVGESEPIRKCIIMAEKVANSKATVLLNGESGTGKELFAHLIHDRSQRQNKPFLSVSCGALPVSILERELFGHEKGAFTGADKQKIGLKSKIGTVFQGSALFDSMNIQENIMLPLKMFNNYSNDEMLDRVNQVLKRVNLEGKNNLMLIKR